MFSTKPLCSTASAVWRLLPKAVLRVQFSTASSSSRNNYSSSSETRTSSSSSSQGNRFRSKEDLRPEKSSSGSVKEKTRKDLRESKRDYKGEVQRSASLRAKSLSKAGLAPTTSVDDESKVGISAYAGSRRKRDSFFASISAQDSVAHFKIHEIDGAGNVVQLQSTALPVDEQEEEREWLANNAASYDLASAGGEGVTSGPQGGLRYRYDENQLRQAAAEVHQLLGDEGLAVSQALVAFIQRFFRRQMLQEEQERKAKIAGKGSIEVSFFPPPLSETECVLNAHIPHSLRVPLQLLLHQHLPFVQTDVVVITETMVPKSSTNNSNSSSRSIINVSSSISAEEGASTTKVETKKCLRLYFLGYHSSLAARQPLGAGGAAVKEGVIESAAEMTAAQKKKDKAAKAAKAAAPGNEETEWVVLKREMSFLPGDQMSSSKGEGGGKGRKRGGGEGEVDSAAVLLSRKAPWLGHRPPYLQFTLYKEHTSSPHVLDMLAKLHGCDVARLQVATNMEKGAGTTQRVTALRVTALQMKQMIHRINQTHRNAASAASAASTALTGITPNTHVEPQAATGEEEQSEDARQEEEEGEEVEPGEEEDVHSPTSATTPGATDGRVLASVPFLAAGDYTYVHSPLQLGTSWGSRFAVRLLLNQQQGGASMRQKNSLPEQEAHYAGLVKTAMQALTATGFVNYFSRQKFSGGQRRQLSAPACDIGRALVQQKWDIVVRLHLQPPSSSPLFQSRENATSAASTSTLASLFSSSSVFTRDPTAAAEAKSRKEKKLLDVPSLTQQPAGGRYKSDDVTRLWKAKRLFVQTGDLGAVLRLLPTYCVTERNMVRKLKQLVYGKALKSSKEKFNPMQAAAQALKNTNEITLTQWKGALEHLPLRDVAKYIQSYQALVWNQMCTHRLQMNSTELLPGDLVQVREMGGGVDVSKQMRDGVIDPTTAAGVDSFTTGASSRASGVTPEPRYELATVTEMDIKKGTYSLKDLVLPLPAAGVQYPKNMLAAYSSALRKDQLTLQMEPNRVALAGWKEPTPPASSSASTGQGGLPVTPSFSSVSVNSPIMLPVGSYRRVFAYAENVTWKVGSATNMSAHVSCDESAPTAGMAGVEQTRENVREARGGEVEGRFSAVEEVDDKTNGNVYADIAFSLKNGSYVTMCLRQILVRQD